MSEDWSAIYRLITSIGKKDYGLGYAEIGPILGYTESVELNITIENKYRKEFLEYQENPFDRSVYMTEQEADLKQTRHRIQTAAKALQVKLGVSYINTPTGDIRDGPNWWKPHLNPEDEDAKMVRIWYTIFWLELVGSLARAEVPETPSGWREEEWQTTQQNSIDQINTLRDPGFQTVLGEDPLIDNATDTLLNEVLDLYKSGAEFDGPKMICSKRLEIVKKAVEADCRTVFLVLSGGDLKELIHDPAKWKQDMENKY